MLAYLTAGAAGMYCGSCLRDNALVVALCRQGFDATLVPTYTPIRTDEPDASLDQVFFGGVNVYLQQQLPWLGRLPRFLDRWLDQPWLIKRLAGEGAPPNPRLLGRLTLSMLSGEHGRQRKEVFRLVDWLADELKPTVINFTNLLIAGCIPTIRRRLPKVPLVVTLQGDDVFLETLRPADRDKAMRLIRQFTDEIDAFVAFNQFYADFTVDYFQLPPERIHVIPLGINLQDFRELPPRPPVENQPPTIGYLARLAPEKGLHTLVDAFLLVRQAIPTARLRIAGWQGKQYRAYTEQQFQRLRDAGLGDAFEYLGTVDRAAKLRFLQSIDLLSVPTDFQDPKGLYVLEAMATGVPVVQPAHGAFPELVESTGGGRLFPAHDVAAMADEIIQLLQDRKRCRAIGQRARDAAFNRHSDDRMAQATRQLYEQLLAGRSAIKSQPNSQKRLR